MNRKIRNVIIDMKDQVEETISMFEEEVDDTVVTPVNRNLFTTYDGESKELCEVRSDIFHSVTAELLFIMKRTRSDIKTAVSYLMTRV